MARPLGVVAYVDPTGAPVARCASSATDAPDALDDALSELPRTICRSPGASRRRTEPSGDRPHPPEAERASRIWRKRSKSEFDIRRRMRSARNGRTHVRLTSDIRFLLS